MFGEQKAEVAHIDLTGEHGNQNTVGYDWNTNTSYWGAAE